MPYSHPHWHYYHYIKHRPNMFFCGPSRLIWFGLGSVATWAWIRHHQQHRCNEGAMWPPRAVDYSGRASHWEREAVHDGGAGGERRQMPPGNPMPMHMSREEWQWRPSPMRQGTGTVPGTSTGTGVGAPGPQLQQSPPLPPPPPPVDHNQDFERLREMGRNAEETISGMSEATIDSMMGALQRLKERLAERRGQQGFQEIEAQQQTSPTELAPPPEEPPRPRHWV